MKRRVLSDVAKRVRPIDTIMCFRVGLVLFRFVGPWGNLRYRTNAIVRFPGGDSSKSFVMIVMMFLPPGGQFAKFFSTYYQVMFRMRVEVIFVRTVSFFSKFNEPALPKSSVRVESFQVFGNLLRWGFDYNTSTRKAPICVSFLVMVSPRFVRDNFIIIQWDNFNVRISVRLGTFS